MKLKEYVLMSLRDLWRRKGRTILTSLGITIGTLLIVTMMGIGIGLKGFMASAVNDGDTAKNISISPLKYMTEEDEESANPMTMQEDYFKKLDDELIKELKDTENTESIVASISYMPNALKFNGKLYSGDISCVGYNEGANIYTSDVVQNIRHEKDNNELKPIKLGKEIDGPNGQALIGKELLNNLGLSEEEILNKEIEIVPSISNKIKANVITKKVTIVGVIDENFENGKKLVLSASDVAELKGFSTLQKDYMQNKGYDQVKVKAKELSDVEGLSERIKDLDYSYQSSIETAKSVEDSLSGINTAFLVLGIIVLVVAAIGIVNTMTMAVIERTKSIGVMKSVGADRGAIKTIFLVQSSLIGLIGGVFGILIGSGINSLIQIFATSKISDSKVDLSITIGLPWYWLLITLVFAMVIALVSGIYPANKASRLDPIEALRR
ncbi:ABC transporter permease [Clostridium sp. SHJSY1]|uniref:ABC transporter permease n=1 Tax=Clostridium sp. SHJSY1 TaxID=2942483 RepID=UPI002875368C|nr:FtsX-like permease family protein [Clostridium sp. SHJSY1]MDS0528218.1 ABC transporter permease [Clostridium sp. SHJSY1]